MKSGARGRAAFALAAGVLCGWLAACGRGASERALIPPDFIRSEALAPISLHTQATVHEFLRLGLGFVSKGKFVDEHGAEREGLIAGLWVYVRGDASQDGVAKVHAGQRLNVAGYKFFVEEIRGGPAGSVRLRVIPPGNAK